MIRRIVIAASAAAVALFAALSAAAPAGASTNVGCNGAGCWLYLSQLIHVSGHGGGSGTYVPPPPPPCTWNPIGDTAAGSRYIISAYHGTNPGTSAPGQAGAAFTQAQDLLKNPQPGSWYQLDINPAASAADQQACQQFPLYDWVPTGHQPPMLPLPGGTLAAYGYNYLPIPALHLKINPTTLGYVNLGTYAWLTPHFRPDRTIRVTAGNQWAVLTMHASKLKVDATGATFTTGENCGFYGSRYQVAQLKSMGAGTVPDCGVLWQSSANQATVTGTVTWTVTWKASDGSGGTMPPIQAQATAGPISVNEIQSVNGG